MAGLGLCAATLTGTQATTRPLIALPDDLVNSGRGNDYVHLNPVARLRDDV
ncbi:hypothetical protein N8315_03265 [Octadecabacter sp.]|nr:hypothetical protein [Octadecabacter sp.]